LTSSAPGPRLGGALAIALKSVSQWLGQQKNAAILREGTGGTGGITETGRSGSQLGWRGSCGAKSNWDASGCELCGRVLVRTSLIIKPRGGRMALKSLYQWLGHQKSAAKNVEKACPRRVAILLRFFCAATEDEKSGRIRDLAAFLGFGQRRWRLRFHAAGGRPGRAKKRQRTSARRVQNARARELAPTNFLFCVTIAQRRP
jgi:hypothetical protein